jgi:hypothetical protein
MAPRTICSPQERLRPRVTTQYADDKTMEGPSEGQRSATMIAALLPHVVATLILGERWQHQDYC